MYTSLTIVYISHVLKTECRPIMEYNIYHNILSNHDMIYISIADILKGSTLCTRYLSAKST